VPLFLAVLGFVIVSAIVVVQQALRFSNRIAGPSYRLIKSMQQVCSGDVSFRVKLRKGDLLGEVADAFNELLDWLNLHPPRGVKTRDLVEVSDAVELPEVCGGKPATRDALLAQQEGDGEPAVAAERATDA
jgi:nitrogen fixation/metabolism regulation signal transduction histidine kinase